MRGKVGEWGWRTVWTEAPKKAAPRREVQHMEGGQGGRPG